MSPTPVAPARPRPSRARRAAIITLVIVVGLTGVGLAAGYGVQRWLSGQVESLGDPFAELSARPTPPAPSASAATETEAEQAAMNLLVLGSDSRISAGDPNQWSYGAQRTDTIMLVHLPADGGSAYVMSFPRDSWVDVPGHGEAKINAAFSYGGPPLLIETIEQLTDVRIDHFVVTDFESFQNITDELGGVLMTLPKEMKVGGTVVPAGKQLLTGEQALRFVRERKSLARGDFDRVQRQQAWMRAIFARMRNEGTLSNPAKSVPFLSAVTRSIATDDGLDQAVMNDLQSRAKDMGSTDITFFTVPFTGTGRSPDGKQSIVVLDQAPLAELMTAVREDTVAAFVESHRDQLDILKPVVD